MRRGVLRRCAVLLAIVACVAGMTVLTAGAAQAAARSRALIVTRLAVRAGPTTGGTLVTIHGHRFQHVRAVAFGGIHTGKIQYVSSTTLRVHAPRHSAGSVYVLVRTSRGTSKRINVARFTYRTPPPQITSMSSHLGATDGGRTVHVYGHNLVDVRYVLVGSVRSHTYQAVSGTRLDLVTPYHSQGTASIRIATGTGTSASTAASTYAFYPLPQITSLDGTDGLTAGGATIVIHGRYLDHATAVTFSGVRATHLAVSGSTQITATTPAHAAGVVDAVATTRVGSSGASSSDKYRYGRANPLRWSTPGVIDPNRGLPIGLSCPTTSFCGLVDQGGVMTYDGTAWHDTTLPASRPWYGVYCHSSSLCVAWTIDSGYVSVFDGADWSTPEQELPGHLAAITCTTDTSCRAFTSDDQEYRFDGAVWSSTGQRVPDVVALTCSSEQACSAITYAGAVYDLADDGTWSRQPASGYTGGQIGFAACADDGSCTVTTGSRQVWTYYGHWTQRASTTFFAQAISCASRDFCAAFDQSGDVATFRGDTWSDPIQATANRLEPLVACAAVDSCLLVDHSGNARTFDGDSVGPTTLIDAYRGGLTSVSCPMNTQFCGAVDQGDHSTSTTDGTQWSVPTLPAGGSAISCASADFCVSVASHYAWTFNGTTWSSTAVTVDPHVAFTDVSCPTSTFCVALSADDGLGNGEVSVFSDGIWSPPAWPSGERISAISCWAAGECAGEASGHYIVYLHDGTWQTPRWLGAGLVTYENSTAMSCPDASVCYIGTTEGQVLTVTSKAVTVTPDVLSGAVTTLTCASSRSCVAFAYDRTAVFDGSSWSASAPSPVYIRALSCPAPGHCVVVTANDVLTADWS